MNVTNTDLPMTGAQASSDAASAQIELPGGKLAVPSSGSNFLNMRQASRYYVDKTGLLKELLGKTTCLDGEVDLILRPRRFGKTLNMSMIQVFLDTDRQSDYIHLSIEEYRDLVRDSFKGLEIMNYPAICEKYMGKVPVIAMSFADVNDEKFGVSRAQLCDVIGEEADRHRFLLDSPKLSESEKTDFRFLLNKTNADGTPSRNYVLSDDDIIGSIWLLSNLLYKHYGVKPAILLDEYDVPLHYAYSNGYYSEMLSLMRGMMVSGFKKSKFYSLGVISGCLRIAKESMFTDMNITVNAAMTNPNFKKWYGFTDTDVDKMLEYYELSSFKAEVKKLYNGYFCESETLYTPWDVCMYIRYRLNVGPNPSKETDSKRFWANTGNIDVIRTFLQSSQHSEKTMDEFQTLVRGGRVKKPINEGLVYSEMYSKIEDMYSVMYYAGLLTAVSYDSDEDAYTLQIPNETLRRVFERKIFDWNQGLKTDLNELPKLLELGDNEKAEGILNAYMLKYVHLTVFATRAKRENFYQGLIGGLLSGISNWEVEYGEETGDGYADAIARRFQTKKAIIIEFKDAKERSLIKSGIEARRQIDTMDYEQTLRDEGYKSILKYGLAFQNRKCILIKDL